MAQHLSKNELEEYLSEKLAPFEITKVIGAYEMAENAHQDNILRDNTPYFEHITRVCRIIIEELKIYDADLISVSLLYNINKSTDKITTEIISYNFGPYIALLVENLSQEHNFDLEYENEIEIDEEEKIKVPGNDYLIIRLADCLDDLRNLLFNPILSPINFILDISSKYLTLVENNTNKHIKYLTNEIKTERNRIFG